MARDCPDRQKGASWRNDGPPTRQPAAIEGGDAVDREYEVNDCHLLICCDTILILYYSNLCKSSVAALVVHQLASRRALAPTTMAVIMLSHGNVDLRAAQLPGDLATKAAAVAVAATRAALHLGVNAATVVTEATAAVVVTTIKVAMITMAGKATTAAHQFLVLLLGNKPLQGRPQHILATQVTVLVVMTPPPPVMVQLPVWVLPRVFLGPTVWVHLLGCLAT